MNIQEVKKMLQDHHDILEFRQLTDDEIDYVESVTSLLSIIEQSENALDDIKHISGPRIDDFAINQLATQALKAIRGN